MSILNYEVHTNVTDHHDFMLKLKNFASAQGWSVQTWETNKIWGDIGGGVYGWIAGAEDFLEIRSTGFGGQAMQFRLRLEDAGVNNNRWLQLGAFAGTVGYDTANAAHPVIRDDAADSNWNSSRYFGLSSETMPAVWFFGNEKIIIWVVKYDATYIQVCGLGSLDLLDSTETEGEWAGHTIGATYEYWYTKSAHLCFDWDQLCIRWAGVALASNTDVQYSFRANYGKYSAITVDFLSYFNSVIIENKYSSRRPLFRQDVYVKDSADGKWFLLGRHWAYRLQHEGLKIGEEITYGSEKYITFPWRVLDVDTSGFAIRVV